ncbi:hypothetical protein H4Q26_017595 [Puccinia striiformis f. sp. tritici PST-130]|nr:hypothetical protein H4Q26_017595 [Puccinia striiformis f. sp. tritici PST-130]
MQQVKGNDDSREVVICEGVVGFKSDFPGGELPYRTRGDLAIAGFQDLIHKYDADEEESDSSSARESSTISPKDEVKLKKELINRLSSSLLPTLRQSVIKVSISPDPADLPREPRTSNASDSMASPAFRNKHAFTNQRHTDYTASVLETIDSMVECLKGSEFDIVQRDWPRKTRSIDDDMKELLHLINPTVSSGKAGGYPACTFLALNLPSELLNHY